MIGVAVDGKPPVLWWKSHYVLERFGLWAIEKCTSFTAQTGGESERDVSPQVGFHELWQGWAFLPFVLELKITQFRRCNTAETSTRSSRLSHEPIWSQTILPWTLPQFPSDIALELNDSFIVPEPGDYCSEPSVVFSLLTSDIVILASLTCSKKTHPVLIWSLHSN